MKRDGRLLFLFFTFGRGCGRYSTSRVGLFYFLLRRRGGGFVVTENNADALIFEDLHVKWMTPSAQ